MLATQTAQPKTEHGKGFVRWTEPNGMPRATNGYYSPVRAVFGTQSNRWHLVGEGDRDYCYGITAAQFAELGETAAREQYLSPTLVTG